VELAVPGSEAAVAPRDVDVGHAEARDHLLSSPLGALAYFALVIVLGLVVNLATMFVIAG
jgi:hypothetical protein